VNASSQSTINKKDKQQSGAAVVPKADDVKELK